MSNLDSLVDDFYGSNKPAAAKPAAQAGAAGIDANDNVRRFLDFLGQAEGADYDVIVGGSRFDDFSRHPNIVGLRTAEGPSTAAGKYQITGTTYRDFAPRLGINDFSPESQDRLALAIIESEGALEDVQAGNFDAAIQKLGGRWASLPSSPYSQPKRDQAFVDRFLGARQQAPARRRLEEAADTFLSTNQGAVEQAVRDQEAMIERGRGMGEFFADTGLAVAGGFGGLGELVGTGIGLVTGDMDNALRSGGAGLREWAQENQSKVMQAQKSLRQLAVESSEDEAGKFFAYLSETLGSPSLAIDFMAEQAPQLLVMGGAGRIAGGAAKAAGLGAASAGTAGTAAAIGAGSSMQGLDAAGQAYDQIKALPRALQLQNATVQKLVADGVPEEDAIERAARAEAMTAGFASGATSAALNLLPWASTLERALAGAGTRGGSRLAGAAKGFIGEGVSESLDEAGGVVAANYATQQFDPSQPLSEGVGEAAAAGALFAPFGGVAGAMQQPTPAAQPASEPAAPKPNSPLQNAANAAAASAPPAAPGAMIDPAADPAVDPATGQLPAEDPRLARARSFVEDRNFISALRGAEGFGKESVTDLLSAYAKARNPNVDPLMRERALADLDAFIDTFVNRPNFTFGKSASQQGTAPGQSVVPASPAASQVAPFAPAAPADDGMTLDGEFRAPSERMAGANPNQLAAPPVLGLPTEEALQARRDAEATYDQAFQDLVKAEQLGASEAELGAYQRALFEADAQRKRIDAELAAADARVADARERESQAARRAILAGLIEQGVPAVNPVSGLAASFTAALQQQGYGNIVPTADEMRTIQRAVDVANAQGANAEPAAPNEMPAELVPARAPTVTPTAPRGDKTDEVVRLLSQGWKLNGKTLVSPRGKRRILNLKEQEAVRNAQKALRAGLDPAAALPGAAQSEAQAAPGTQGVVPAAPVATATQEGGVTDDVPTAEQVAPQAQEAGGQEGAAEGGKGALAAEQQPGISRANPNDITTLTDEQVAGKVELFKIMLADAEKQRRSRGLSETARKNLDEKIAARKRIIAEAEAEIERRAQAGQEGEGAGGESLEQWAARRAREIVDQGGLLVTENGQLVVIRSNGAPTDLAHVSKEMREEMERNKREREAEAAAERDRQAQIEAQARRQEEARQKREAEDRAAAERARAEAEAEQEALRQIPVGAGDTFQWNGRTYQLTKMPEGEGRGGAIEVTVWRDGAITPVNDTEYGFTREQFENATGRKLKDAAPAASATDLQKSTEEARGEGTGIGAPAQPAITTALDAAAHEAATSPLNDLPQPTDEQKKAGNYAKGFVRLHGMDISIENPQGSVRSGTAPDGTRWENRIAHHYGYIKGSRGADNDQIDVFLTDGAEEATVAWVIDQKNDDGSFDEHKAVIGPKTEDEARAAYLANYDEGWDGLGAITSMPMEAFKAWALDGKRKRKALAYVEPPKEFVHNGVRIYPTTINAAGEARLWWGVESAENKARREAGERYGFGDSLRPTIESAMADADRQIQRDAERAEFERRKAEIEAEKQAEAAARKADTINGFLDGKAPNTQELIRKALDKQYRFDGVVRSVREQVEWLSANGALEVSTFEEPKIKPMSRTQFNRATQREQDAHEKKMREAGTKTVYLVGGSELGKYAYDYAQHLLARKAQTDISPDTKPAEAAPQQAEVADIPEPKNWRTNYGAAQKYAEALGIGLRGEDGKYLKLPALAAAIEAAQAGTARPVAEQQSNVDFIKALEEARKQLPDGYAIQPERNSVSLMENGRYAANGLSRTAAGVQEAVRLAKQRAKQATARINLRGKEPGDVLQMDNGNIYRIEGVENGKIKATRNPNQLNERIVLLEQDGFDRLVADDAEVKRAAIDAGRDARGATASDNPAPAPAPAPSKLDAAAVVLSDKKRAAAEKLKRLLDSRKGTLNSGIDPELMLAVAELGAVSIAEGAVKFAQWARDVIQSARAVGIESEQIKPFLKEAYGAIAANPEKYDLTEDQAESMDALRDVRKTDVDALTSDNQGADKGATARSLSNPDDKFDVARDVADHFIGGGSFKTIVEARKFIADRIGQKVEPATELAKQADETVETGVVLAAREIVASGRKQGRSDQVIYDRLLSLYEAQPNLAVRSSTSVRDQAYSTPVPLAFVASRLAGISDQSSVYEPTAGNGALVLGSSPDATVVNELNPARAEMLKRVLPGANVRSNNAANWKPPQKFASIIMNPPFGATNDANGNTIYYDVLPNYSTREVDHAIAFKALETLEDDGRAVLIVGGVNARSEEGRREGYRGKSKREFYYHLYDQFNVTDHFTVDGDMYAKQGAGYPVDVIVIQGRGKSSRHLPAADLPQIIGSYAELKEKLNEADRMVPAGNVGGAGVDRGAGDARASDTEGLGRGAGSAGGRDGVARTESDASGRAGDENARIAGRDEPAASGRGAGQVQPGTANGAQLRDDRQRPVPGAGKTGDGGGKAGTRNRPGDVAGVGVVDGERVQSGLNDRRGQEQETALQVAYEPRSQASSVGTLVPKNMRDAIQDSLEKLEQQWGGVDGYVAEALNYDVDTLKQNFSAEQIDALALAIQNAVQGRGFIIGDQTGIGKGRVVAAMIRYALVSGKTPIFVTEKPNLYADMIRDMDDIGMTEELGLDRGASGILITNGSESIPYTLLRQKDGEVVENVMTLRAPASGKALDDRLRAMRESGDLGPYKVIFTTYNQLQTVKGKETERQRFVKQFGAGGYMIFDESHNAGGAGETQARTKEQREAAKAGATLASGRAAFVRELVRNADGTFFSSATYAKRPDVMDLYSSTNMLLAVNTPAELAPAIKQGGVPMQQVVAAMLTKDGQYIRRERTFAGVSYDTVETSVDQATAENMASAMRSILAFSRAKESVVKAIQEELDKSGALASSMNGESVSVQGANFGSIMHNLIDQMLLSLKAQQSVAFAIERLKEGEKVVLTVSNTMGSFLKSYADEMELNAGDPVALSFKDLYLRYLEKQRYISVKRTGEAKGTPKRLTDDELGPALTQMFNQIAAQIESSGFGAAPISPIDYLHAELRKAGYKTDEITGRTVVLDYSRGTPRLGSRTATIKQRLQAISGFNNGDTDVIILNQSGSTGLSLHASSKFKDQRKRHMIIVQAEKNIDTHMQMLGRVHRTGQVRAPAYSQMMADVPAEMRPAAVLMKKMAALNANTTASRESAVTADGVIDFMNDYGGQVVHEYLTDNPDVLKAIGGSDVIKLLADPTEATEDDIRKFTGYIPVLPIKQQEEIYSDLIERYRDLIERENSMGTNKLEARALDLDAVTVDSEAVTPERGGDSEFARPAFMERVDVKRTVKPFSTKEVRDMVAERLGDRTADQIAAAMIEDLRVKATEYARARVEELRLSGADDMRLSQERDKFNAQYADAKTRLSYIKIGEPVAIVSGDGQVVHGVVIDIQNNGKTKNPLAGSAWKVSFALANGESRTMNATFSQIGSRFEVRAERRVNYLNPETGRVEIIDAYDMFDQGTTTRREKRWMVTGNILAGFAAYPGQIVNYTRNDGTTQQGVMMPRIFDYNKIKKNAKVPMRNVEMASDFLGQAGIGARVGTADLGLQIENRGYVFTVTVPASKREGGTYYLDRNLTDALGVDFYKNGSRMIARTDDQGRLSDAINYLTRDRGINIVALSNQDVARKIAGLEDVKTDGPAVFRAGDTMPDTITVDGIERPTANSEGRPIHPSVEGVRNFWRWFGESAVTDDQGRPLVTYHGTTEDVADGALRPGEDAWSDGIFFTDSAQIAASVYARGTSTPNTAGVREALARMSDAQLEDFAERLRSRAGWGDFWLEIDEPAFRQPYADQIAEYADNTFDHFEGGTQAIDTLAAELGINARMPAEGANVMPSYLSLQDPMMVDGSGLEFDPEQQAEWIAQAKAAGHDGLVIRNYSDGGFGVGNDFRSAGRHDVFVAFQPEQAKSATGNSGDFSASPSVSLRTANEENSRVGFSRVDADRFIEDFLAATPNAPEIVAVNTFDQLPAFVQQEARNQGETEKTVKGVLVQQDGVTRVYVVVGNHASLTDFEATVFHEVAGHFGMREMLGPDFTQKLNQIYLGVGGQGGLVKIMNARGLGKQVQNYIRAIQQAQRTDADNARKAAAMGRKYRIRWTDAVAKAVLTEEVYAHIAEQLKDRPGLLDKFKTLIGALRQWLRDHTFMRLASLGETDLLYMLSKARKELQGPSGGPKGGRRTKILVSDRETLDRDGERLDRADPDLASAMMLARGLGLQERDGVAVFAAQNSALDRLADALIRYARAGSSFIYGNAPSMRSGDISEIARAFSDEGTTVRAMGGGDTITIGAISEGVRSTMRMRRNADGTYSINATTANPLGTAGRNGMRLYQALFAYAANNGLTVMPERVLTHVNRLRRTSAMLSAALRSGTTDFTVPHADQGVIGWQAGNFAGNVGALAAAEAEMVAARIPAFADLSIDVETGQVYASNPSVLGVPDGTQPGAAADGRDVPGGRGEAVGRGDSVRAGVGGVSARSESAGDRADQTGAGQGGTRSADGRAFGNGAARAGNAVGGSLERQPGGRVVSDSALEGYLARLGAGRGGSTGHGIGLTTLKRALMTRALLDGEADNIGTPQILYRADAAPPSVFRVGDSATIPRDERRDYLAGAASRNDGPLRQFFTDLFAAFKSPSSKVFGPLHKSISTQLHKAWVNKDYGEVFYLADRYERDISRFSAEPSALAPKLLPTFDKIGDAFDRMIKGDKVARMSDKVANAIFEGTLAGATPTEGRVWTDQELRDRFELDDAQIELYREARKTTDLSLDISAAGLAWQMVKKYIGDLKEAVRTAPADAAKTIELSMRELEDQLREEVQMVDGMIADAENEGEAAKLTADRSKLMRKAQEVAEARIAAEGVFKRAEDLKAGGYFPLMRFGKYNVDVTIQNEDGETERLGFYKFETEAEAKMAEQRLRREFPEANIERSISSEEAWKVYQGVDPETVALFAEHIGSLEGLDVKDDVLQAWYREAVNNRSAFKRMIHRKGTEGFDRDLTRVLASFVTSNARLAARQFNMPDIDRKIADLKQRKAPGDVVDEAERLRGYIENPEEPFQALKGWMFAWFLGGSISSALLNATSIAMTTMPYLSQFGAARAAIEVKNALTSGATGKVSDPELQKALLRAAEDGKVDPQQVHHLFHEGMRPFISKLPFGQNMRARAQGLMTAWGYMFGWVENFNRRTTFIAAYRMAKANPKLGDAYEFAVRAVDWTQLIYSKSNRSNWARGTGPLGGVGVAAFTFRQYSIGYVELLIRMAKSGPAGKRAALMQLGILVMLAGLQGFPGAEDLEDLIDTVAQRMGYTGNSRLELHRYLKRVLGEEFGNIVQYGLLSAPMLRGDMGSRVGLGDFFPATAIAKPSEQNRASQIAELFGPPASMGEAVMKALDASDAGGGALGILKALTPVAVSNAWKGVDMAVTGRYNDTRGRKVVEVDMLDAVLKGVGIQPSKINAEQRPARMIQMSAQRVRQVKSNIHNLRAQAIVEKNADKRRRADEMLRDWNAKNPDARLSINSAAILRRVKEMNAERRARLMKTLPKELRQSASEEYAQ